MYEFVPLHYKNELNIVNPKGDVGLVTLWSPPRVILKHLQAADVDLEPSRSRVAVAGTLYGEGLPHLLRNLLYNPQIHYLALFGEEVDKGISKAGLIGFFSHGLEKTAELGAAFFRIVGTETIIDGDVQPVDFQNQLNIVDLGPPKATTASARVKDFFDGLPPQRQPEQPRREVKIAKVDVPRLPSDPRAHNIIANTPMQGWQELIHRLFYYGHEVTLKKGPRIELQNVKVTINHPEEEPESVLKKNGFSLKQFKSYQKRILSSDRPSGASYTYGDRLRGYFDPSTETHAADTLSKIITLLKADPECRKAYVSLWDTKRDLLSEEKGHPCLVSLFFRKFEEKLTTTVVFRTHNALTAWPENVYGVIAIQRYVAGRVGMKAGPITVMSHSISIDPAGGIGKTKAKAIAELRNEELKNNADSFQEDPHGYFQISVDNMKLEIVVKHQFKGIHLHSYTGNNAIDIEQQIVADVAISNIAHALFLGRELARAEARLDKLTRSTKKRR